MKKNSLTTAVIAGIAGVAGFAGLANAVYLNPDGLGQVLLYPYYTVNEGQNTLLSVDNTNRVAKAVKVRFLEGYNTREVLDFNLFLSPYDVWTATIFALHDGTHDARLQLMPAATASTVFAGEPIHPDYQVVDATEWVVTFPTKAFHVDVLASAPVTCAEVSRAAYLPQFRAAENSGSRVLGYHDLWTRPLQPG